MTKQTTFDFKEQLAKGVEGEVNFLLKYENLIEKTDGGFISDFKILSTGDKIELKTDFYDPRKTKNFFFEFQSNKEKASPGGPWQALMKGSKYFVYRFSRTGQEFWFNTEDLVAAICLIDDKSLVEIQNKGWVTTGYKLPRKKFEHLLLDTKDIL